ncbi:MAG: hypothetical protein ACT4PM_06735 [Gemmatimonadales bacterium]
MITFWATRAGIEGFLSGHGQPLRAQVTVRPYEWPETPFEVAAGAQVFSALDELTPSEREGVSALYEQLSGACPGTAVLNNPRRCLLRPALLAGMAEQGINTFRAFPATAIRRVSRFPVFVRGAYDHNGNLTGLLGSARELRRALLALQVRGYRLGDLLIVEFCDASDRHGVFRKYGAFKVGDSIVPFHCLAGKHWMVKLDTAEPTLELARERLSYVERNPDEAWLREVFDLAGIDYGRADYGRKGGRPQLWEINLNPTVGGHHGRTTAQLDPAVAAVWERARELAHAQLREAFAALDRSAPDPSGSISVALEPALRVQITRSLRQRRRRRLVFRWLDKIYASPVGAPFRAVLTWIIPRS